MVERRILRLRYNIITIYFVGDKSLLKTLIPNKSYPEAISTTLSLAFPLNNIDAEYASVGVSPTKEVEQGVEDYDWVDIDLPINEINLLLEKYYLHK